MSTEATPRSTASWQAVRARWPDDHMLIARIEKHRADERKHYLMFRRWFERRGSMPLAVDRTCGHIDRFVGIMFGSTIDELDPLEIVARDDLFERMCRVIALTEKRGHRQVEILLRHPLVRADATLMKIFRIIEQDEPSHWAPYEDWLASARAQAGELVGARDRSLHSRGAIVPQAPHLFLAPRLSRRLAWPDEEEHAEQPTACSPSMANA